MDKKSFLQVSWNMCIHDLSNTFSIPDEKEQDKHFF